VFFVLFVFVQCLVYPLLPVSLDFPFLVALSVFSNVYSVNYVIVIYMLGMCLSEDKLEGTKIFIRSHKSVKDRQYND